MVKMGILTLTFLQLFINSLALLSLLNKNIFFLRRDGDCFLFLFSSHPHLISCKRTLCGFCCTGNK